MTDLTIQSKKGKQKGAEVLPKLTNKAGGNAMFTQTDLLFANEFIPDTFADVPQDRSTSYQAYREKKNQELQKQKQIDTVKKLNEPVPRLLDRKERYANNLPPNAPLPPGPSTSVVAGTSVTKDVKRKVFIDSKDRDKITYPDAADFVISWGRAFANVKRIQLISLEFPNVVPSVTPDNRMLYWQNLEDMDLDPAFPTYPTALATGSYTLSSIQDELASKMKFVKRRNGITVEGQPPYRHMFIVETNQETDYVGFTSIIAQAAGNNPVVTVAGSTTVHFKQKNHGYNDGERIHILGIMGIVGGLPASEVNGAYNIKKIDEDRFSFEIQATPITSATGGGTLVKSGREAPFQFMFGSNQNTVADILGFPVENSSQTINQTDPLTSGIKYITGVIPGDTFTQILCPDHGLKPNDRVQLMNFNVSPSVYADDRYRGVFEVYAVPSQSSFLIKYGTLSVNDISSAYVGTQIFRMYYPGHGFNRIVDIQQVGFNQVQVTTLFDHGFNEKSFVRLANTNSVPNIDGYYKVIPIDNDSFAIKSTDVTKPLAISKAGYKGILAPDYVFYLYGVTPFGGFNATELNNVPFEVREIIDADNFTFVGQYGYSEMAETGGGGNIRINSKLHGWRGTQSNSPDGVLYKNVRLSGDNYCYMCIPGMKSDSIVTTSPVKDIFAKLFITAVPGVVIFNQFDASPIDLTTPIPVLSELRFQIRTSEDYLVTFNGLDYSFGLEIISEEQSDDSTMGKSTPIKPPEKIV